VTTAQERELAALVGRYHFMRQPLSDFIPNVSPHLVTPWHLKPILAALDLVEERALRLLIACPPRHGKSIALMHAAVWFLMRNPSKTVCIATHSQALASAFSRQARQIAEAAGLSLSKDSRSVKEWRTTMGGGFLAVGVGAGLTGRGVDLMIIDDPIADREDAESAIVMGKLWDWWGSVAMTRLQPGASCIVVHTRWSSGDLQGRLLAERGDQWVHISIPAIDEDGNALWPGGGWDLEALRQKRAEIGEWEFAALYQGSPRPRGSQLFKDFVRYEAPILADRKIVIGVDPAATAKTRSDYSAAVVLAVGGYGADMRGDVLEVYRAQVEIPDLCVALEKLQAKHNGVLVIEDAGAAKAVPQIMRRSNPKLRLHPVTPKGDKGQRAQPVALAVNEGRLRVPTSATWLADFMSELATFTGTGADPHDDQTDALAHAWNFAAEHAVRPLHLERGPFATGSPRPTDEWGRALR
jgi:predicted phage terminase large subunit-like protein